MSGAKITFSLLHCITMLTFVFAGGQAGAAWVADPGDKRQLKAFEAIARFQERVPRTEQFFDDAYAFAILPSVTRVGLGFGGAYGRGIVIEGDDIVGRTSFKQFTSGMQVGARYFSMIIFFKDKEALEYYKIGELQFMGQASISVATAGLAGSPAYNDGVAVVTDTRLGLMAEFTISGAKFTFKPLSAE